MGNIVASLADSICRHPDVTLESGLVLNTIGELLLCFKLIIFAPFWNIPTCADLSAFFGKACPGSSGGMGVACFYLFREQNKISIIYHSRGLYPTGNGLYKVERKFQMHPIWNLPFIVAHKMLILRSNENDKRNNQ